MIYLDNASTYEYRNIDDVIVNTITTAMKDSWQNPSSLYATNVKDKINKCRTNIANFIGAKSEEIYFTSGSSESNNWAIRGWTDRMIQDFFFDPCIIVSAIEHKSILGAINNAELNAITKCCKVDEYGMVDLEHLEHLLKKSGSRPVLVSVCLGNNEIGTVNHIKMIADLVHKYGGVLHTDATQSFGHIPINVEELEIDMMSVSGHKISPVLKGIGFLYKKNWVDIKPLIYGNQEQGLRGGTENTFGIIGLGKALEFCDVSCEKIEEIIDKRNYFISLLESKFGCKLNGHKDYRLPNNINVTFPQEITGETLLYMLDMSGIKISTSSACNSTSIKPSHVLKAIGLSDKKAMKSVRFTLCEDITYEDINYVIKEIAKAIKIISMEGYGDN